MCYICSIVDKILKISNLLSQNLAIVKKQLSGSKPYLHIVVLKFFQC